VIATALTEGHTLARLPQAGLLYLIVASAILYAWRRKVQSFSLAAGLILLCLPMLFTAPALLTGRVYAPIDLPFMSEPLIDDAAAHGIENGHNGALSDLYLQMIPWQSAVRQSLSRMEWPLWNPYLLCGTLLAPNMQSAVYDPLMWIGLLLPLSHALTFGATMTFFLAVLFTFSFARSLGIGEAGALLAAAGFMCAEIVAFFVSWPLGRAWALFPLILLGVRLVIRDADVRAVTLLTAAFALEIAAGHPESVLHTIFLGAVYGVFELTQSWLQAPIELRRKELLRRIALATASGVIALLLTAIVLLPFATAAPETRDHATRKTVYAEMTLPFAAETAINRLALSILPWYGGAPERDDHTASWEPTQIRVGSIVLALSFCALIVRRGPHTSFFAVLAVTTAWIGLDGWPLAHALHRVPLFDIAINNRFCFPAVFFLSLLAGMTIDSWPVTIFKRLGVAAILLVVAVSLFIATQRIAPARLAAGIDPLNLHVIAWSELATLIVLAAATLFSRFRRLIVPLVFGLVLIQRVIADGFIYPAYPQSMFYPPNPLLTKMQQDESIFRMAGTHYAFLPDTAALYGLEDARGYEAMTFRRLAETYPTWSLQLEAANHIIDKSLPMLSFLNIKYVIGGINEREDDQWKMVLKDRNSTLLENARVLPRAFVPRQVRYENDLVLTVKEMVKARDFADMAWISAPEYPSHQISNGPGTVGIRRNGATWELDVVMENDGWVVISESAWPGWRSYVDGKRVRWHFANHAFLGVYLSRGTHQVRLVYLPEAFTRGRAISLLTLAAIVAFFMLSALRRHRGAEPRAVGI
jgi:hypothetical protein